MSKQMVRQVDRETCFFCGSEGPLERHHVYPDSLGGSDDDRNLVDLCPTCHTRLEQLHHDRLLDALAEAPVDGSADVGGGYDHYDAQVIDALESGEAFSVGRLQKLYQRAGLVNSATIKRRIKRLKEMGCWADDVKRGKIFVGVGDD